jgi:hypothetical protein
MKSIYYSPLTNKIALVGFNHLGEIILEFEETNFNVDKDFIDKFVSQSLAVGQFNLIGYYKE